MKEPDYFTPYPCVRCGGDGYDPDQPVLVERDQSPLACIDCEGSGKEIDTKIYDMVMDEHFSRIYKL